LQVLSVSIPSSPLPYLILLSLPPCALCNVCTIQGSFERAISLFRTSYSFVAVSRKHLPDTVASVMWFTQYAPVHSTYTPFYVASVDPPKAYTRGSLFHYDSSVSFWNFCAAGNWASRFYLHTIDTIKSVQNQLESGFDRELASMDAIAASALSLCASDNSCDVKSTEEGVVRMLTEFTHSKGEETVSTWRALLPKLITTFHDGYRAQNQDGVEVEMKRLFYPKWYVLFLPPCHNFVSYQPLCLLV
jgi:dipeptidase